MKSLQKLFMASIAINLTLSSFAQTPITNDEEVIDPVLIKSVRVEAVEFETLPYRSITQIPAVHIHGMLQRIPGLDLRRRGVAGSQADLSYRGGTFEQTQVRLDGWILNDAQTGHHTMNLPIDAMGVRMVSMHSGPNSWVYGAGAANGMLEIESRASRINGGSDSLVSTLGLHGYIGSSFQQDDSTGKSYLGQGLTVDGDWITKKTVQYWAVGGEWGNGFRYNSGYRNLNSIYNGTWNIDNKHALKWILASLYNKFGARDYYASPADREAEEEVNTSIQGLGYVFKNKQHSFDFRVMHRLNKDIYTFVRQDPSIFQNNHRTNQNNVSANYAFQPKLVLGNDLFKLGESSLLAEARHTIISSPLADTTRADIGLRAMQRFDFLQERLVVHAGLYLNHNTDYGTRLYPGGSFVFSPSLMIEISGMYGMGFRNPSFTDLYYDGPRNIGNPSLAPEVAVGGEIELEIRPAGNIISVTYFDRVTDDLIEWTRSLNPSDTTDWQPNNFGEIRHKGLQLTWRSKTYGPLQFGGSYTWLNSDLTTSLLASQETRYAQNHFRHQTLGYVRMQKGPVVWTNDLRYQIRTSDGSNTIVDGGYLLWDGRIAYEKFYSDSKLRSSVFFDIQNIFDTQYQEQGIVPLPGRWYRLGFSVRWG